MKLTCNTDFFKEIDNEYKAYTLGYLFANGSVYEPRGELAISGKYEVLDKIRGVLEADNPIKKDRGSNRLTIYNRGVVEDLEALGLMGYKSETLAYPFYIDPKLERHFIRGFFEGKGSYMIEVERKKLATNIACGSHRFLEGLRDRLVTLGMPRANIHRYGARKLTYMMRYYKKDTQKLHSILYDGARIYSSDHKARYLYGVSCTESI